MALNRRLETTSPFEAARRMSSLDASAPETKDWTHDMVAVGRRRDRDAFMRLYDHFMPRLCQYLRGIGSPEAIAEELAQEAMLRLWQHAGAYDPSRSAASTWLFRIARNLHIDRYRREPTNAIGNPREAEYEAEFEPDGRNTEDYTESVQLKRRIDALSSVQGRLIRMSYFEAKTHQEISAELDMPLGTVKSHLRRAFLRLQGELGEPA
jgi:RNA polymerase sigma-70 factor (ECF subfamily)